MVLRKSVAIEVSDKLINKIADEVIEDYNDLLFGDINNIHDDDELREYIVDNYYMFGDDDFFPLDAYDNYEIFYELVRDRIFAKIKNV